jgi:ABC-2 type transport system ATP-binding protein
MLEIRGLYVHRSHRFALDIPALAVRPGNIVCITGPNGSGKTTLIDCMAGLLTPQRGSVAIHGKAVTANRKTAAMHIGLAPDDEDWLIPELTANEYLSLLEQTYRKAGIKTPMRSTIDRHAEKLHFSAYDQRTGLLSHGNKKKVQLLAALMHTPPVIIIDELRNGLDPIAIIAAEQLVLEAAQAGSCVVAATHDLWWAQRMADEIVLLVDGQIAHHQSKTAILQTHGSVEQLFIDVVQP